MSQEWFERFARQMFDEKKDYGLLYVLPNDFEQVIVMKERNEAFRMYLRDYSNKFDRKKSDDIVHESIVDEIDHNHPNIFVCHYTKYNCIVFLDWLNRMYNQ